MVWIQHHRQGIQITDMGTIQITGTKDGPLDACINQQYFILFSLLQQSGTLFSPPNAPTVYEIIEAKGKSQGFNYS